MSKLSEQLEAFLRLKLGDNVSLAGEIKRLQGGFDTHTFAFDIENAPAGIPQELVLRLFRSAGQSVRVVAESTIQNAAHSAGHPVPLVPIDSVGHLLTQRPFILMERLRGSVLGAQLEDPAVVARLPGLMAELQVGLHRIDSAGLRSRLTGAGVDIGRMTPAAMLKRISAIAEKSGIADLAAINRWLTDHWPDQPANPAICHGDFHPNNILFEDGEVTGLIDWANVMFTHPEFDVAVTHMIMSIGPLDETSIPREELQKIITWATVNYLDSYRSQLPIDDDLLKYYGALRAAHAYAKVVASKRGVDLPYLAHDGYAWEQPVLFAVIRNLIEKTTAVVLGPA
jgi:aminoglycoside phosphotransferase (APT) family kinase protein